MIVGVVIPALDEEESIAGVLERIPPVACVVVADNGSRDRTASRARERGARVVPAPVRGYGFACLAGIAALPPAVDTVVFLDADGADDPSEMPRLLEALGEADLVVGSRLRGLREPGALLPHAWFGNWLASRLMGWLYSAEVTDLGPFRAIRRPVLEALDMQGSGYRWTTEMMVKALRAGYRVVEVPVSYRRRSGRSKVSGTLAGSVRAAWGILTTLAWYARWRPGPGVPARTPGP